MRLILFSIVFLLVCYWPLQYQPDSSGYLNGEILRAPAYPLFLDLFQWLPGNWFEWALKLVQLLIGFIAIRHLINTLLRLKFVGLVSAFVITLLLLLPYVYTLKIANYVLSEALAYPLYLLIISHCILAWTRLEKEPLIFAAVLTFMLLLTRSQFIFLVPVGICIFFAIGRQNRALWRQSRILLLWIALPFLTTLTDRSYHYLQNGAFVPTAWTGVHFMSAGMFLADETDSDLFTEALQQRYFQHVFRSLKTENLQIHYPVEALRATPHQTYLNRYSEIVVANVYREGRTVLPDAAYLSDQESLIAIDRLTKEMAPVLLRDNLKEYLNLILKNISYGFGGATYLLLMLLIWIMALGSTFINRHKIAQIVLLFASLALLNVTVIGLGPHAVDRLTFYNDWMFAAIFLVLWHHAHKTSKKTAS